MILEYAVLPLEPAVAGLVQIRQAERRVAAARQSAAAGDAAGVRASVLEWGRLQWPHDPPLSIGEFANRVEAPLADELRRLSSASYGPRRDTIDKDALAKALRTIAIRREHTQEEPTELLPPLMPPAA